VQTEDCLSISSSAALVRLHVTVLCVVLCTKKRLFSFSQRKLEQFDDSILKKIFLSPGPEHDLTRLYEKLCLTWVNIFAAENWNVIYLTRIWQLHLDHIYHRMARYTYFLPKRRSLGDDLLNHWLIYIDRVFIDPRCFLYFIQWGEICNENSILNSKVKGKAAPVLN
jgi:hypothetical protein